MNQRSHSEKLKLKLCPMNAETVSFMKLTLLSVILGLGMSSPLHAQGSMDRPKVVIDEVDLQGATHLPGTAKEHS